MTFQHDEQAIEAEFRKRCVDDPYFFLNGLSIACKGGGVLFQEIMEDFQKDTFKTLCPALIQLRDGDTPDNGRFWLERTKKASKDADLAAAVMWLCAFPTRPFYGQIGAVDRAQAGIIKERIAHLLVYNEWLNDYVEIVSWEIRSKHPDLPCHFDIEARDIHGSHGGTPDLLIVNELSHIAAWEFFENLMDNADGVPHGMIIVATNAGFKNSEAWELRQSSIKGKRWKFFLRKEPAPWHNELNIADARARNTPSRFKRLWQGEWVSGKGDALAEEAIDQCFSLTGPIKPDSEQGKDLIYIAAMDLGVRHDHSAIVVLGVDVHQQRICTAWWKSWEPFNGEVDLIDVERTALKVGLYYRVSWFGYDPSQAELMAQRLRTSLPMVTYNFTGSNCTDMAESLVQAVCNKKLDCYDDAKGTLRGDFGKFSIEERGSTGYKLEAVSDSSGHADVGTALVIALPKAIELLEGNQNWDEDTVLFDEAAHAQTMPGTSLINERHYGSQTPNPDGGLAGIEEAAANSEFGDSRDPNDDWFNDE